MEEENIWKKCNKLYSNEGDFYKYEVHSIKNILLPPPIGVMISGLIPE